MLHCPHEDITNPSFRVYKEISNDIYTQAEYNMRLLSCFLAFSNANRYNRLLPILRASNAHSFKVVQYRSILFQPAISRKAENRSIAAVAARRSIHVIDKGIPCHIAFWRVEALLASQPSELSRPNTWHQTSKRHNARNDNSPKLDAKHTSIERRLRSSTNRRQHYENREVAPHAVVLV